MVLHKDDPEREGNLTDAEYVVATQELIDAQGDDGLHTVPKKVMDAAVKDAGERHGQ
jgi:hypothetical protein